MAKENLYLPQRIEWLFKWLFQEVPVKEKGMVSSVPRKKKHKEKIKENLCLQLQLPNGVPNGCSKRSL